MHMGIIFLILSTKMKIVEVFLTLGAVPSNLRVLFFAHSIEITKTDIFHCFILNLI